jgi:hypothetical protein
MAGEHGSRQFVRVRWAIAFTLGIAAGTLSTTLFGLTGTLWALAGGSAVALAVGLFEWFGHERLLGPRRPNPRLQRPVRVNFAARPRKTIERKPPLRRGQLYAITGRKTVDPPSSGTS